MLESARLYERGPCNCWTEGFSAEVIELLRRRGDLLSLQGDQVEGEALIRPMMKAGRRLSAAKPLERSRQRALGELKRLPEALKCLERGPEYQVSVSERLKNLARQVDATQSQSTTPDRQERKPFSEQAVTS